MFNSKSCKWIKYDTMTDDQKGGQEIHSLYPAYLALTNTDKKGLVSMLDKDGNDVPVSVITYHERKEERAAAKKERDAEDAMRNKRHLIVEEDAYGIDAELDRTAASPHILIKRLELFKELHEVDPEMYAYPDTVTCTKTGIPFTEEEILTGKHRAITADFYDLGEDLGKTVFNYYEEVALRDQRREMVVAAIAQSEADAKIRARADREALRVAAKPCPLVGLSKLQRKLVIASAIDDLANDHPTVTERLMRDLIIEHVGIKNMPRTISTLYIGSLMVDYGYIKPTGKSRHEGVQANWYRLV